MKSAKRMLDTNARYAYRVWNLAEFAENIITPFHQIENTPKKL